MLVSMLTPAAIVLAAADLIRHLQGQGTAVTGCSMTTGGFQAEGTTKDGKRLVLLVSFDEPGPQVTVTVMRQVGKRAVSKRETAATHNAAMLAALK